MEMEHLISIGIWVIIIVLVAWAADHLHPSPKVRRYLRLGTLCIGIAYLLYVVLIYIPGLEPSGWHR